MKNEVHAILQTRFGRWISPTCQWHGFVYLAAVADWFGRRVLSWRISITMQADFCIEAVMEALARLDTPEISNTDRGSQFTSTDRILVNEVSTIPGFTNISMYAKAMTASGIACAQVIARLIAHGLARAERTSG